MSDCKLKSYPLINLFLFLQILIIFYNRAQVATAIDAEFEDMEIQYGIQTL